MTIPIPSHPEYSVDLLGNVYGKTGKPLNLFPGTGGYLRFTTYTEGRWQQVSVHVKVCEAFHGPRPNGMHAVHSNGICTDNRAVNLSWKTATENEADKQRHGRSMNGERHHQHKLTDEQVLRIRKSSAKAMTMAREYGVNIRTIYSILARESWRHLPSI